MTKVVEIRVEIQVKWSPLDPADCQRAVDEIKALDNEFSVKDGYEIARGNPIAVKVGDDGLAVASWRAIKNIRDT